MKGLLSHKIFDTILLFLLVFSSGGVLFVFNRNTFSVLFLFLCVYAVFIVGKEIKKNIFNTAIISFVFINIIFILNYFFSDGDQIYLKYGFHLMNIFSCFLLFVYFINNRTRLYFMQRIRFVFRVILVYSLINFFAYVIIGDSLTQVIYNIEKSMMTFHYLLEIRDGFGNQVLIKFI